MHDLAKEFMMRLSSGLRRRGIQSCSKWAEQFRVLGGKDFPGPWRFRYHPWLKEMHDSTARFNVGRKSAQMGFTETVLNKTFFKIDIERVDCLYVLPNTTPDASDFSAARFDPALELSPHLNNLFSAVKNVGHKRAGATNLYIRGSHSRPGLKSVPVGFLVLDEVNEMCQENIPLALERQSGQMEKEAWAISTPTADDAGIDELYKNTTQEHFFFPCPLCKRLTELTFPECLVITGQELTDPALPGSHYICKECKGKLIQETKVDWLAEGRWVPSYTNFDDRGFYVNQMYSSTISPLEMAKAYIKAQHNTSDEQEFYNSKLGLPHTPEGSRINDKHIAGVIGDYLNSDEKPSSGIITMGIDVGKWLHYEIDYWTLPNYISADLNIESICKVLKIGKCLNFEDLDLLMHEFGINFAVIDANPERRKAFEFANRHYQRVKLCFYGQGVQGKQIHIGQDVEPTITVDRTSWLDLSLGRFRGKIIQIPKDTPEEYKLHLKALIRILKKDKNGNPVAIYDKKTNDQDHYAHARNYSEIALPLAMSFGTNQDITDGI